MASFTLIGMREETALPLSSMSKTLSDSQLRSDCDHCQNPNCDDARVLPIKDNS